MKWKDIREKYPDSWVLFEALQAHSDEGKRIVNDIAVLEQHTFLFLDLFYEYSDKLS